MSDDDLRRRRMLRGILPSLLLLAVAVQLVLLVRGNDSALTDYEAGDHASAYDSFVGLRDLGLVQPWVAPFNAGAAAYRQKDWASAVARFEEALDEVGTDRECDVRVNLALTHVARATEERRTGSRATALRAFADARTALGARGCSRRLEGLVNKQIRSMSSSDQPDEENSRLSEQEKIEKLERQNDEARRQHEDDESDPPNEPDEQIQW
jgi:hypothetical protein